MRSNQFFRWYEANVCPSDTTHTERRVLMKSTSSSKYKTPFKLYRRPSRTGNKREGIIYVQFRSPESKRYWTYGKSTGTTDEAEAIEIAWKWYSTNTIPDRINGKLSSNHSVQLENVLCALRNGTFKENELCLILQTLEKVYAIKGGIVPNTDASLKVKDYFLEFWDIEKSPYLKEQKMSGKNFHKGNIIMLQQIVQQFWIPRFGEREIGSFTKKELQEWLWELHETKFNIGQKKEKIEHLSNGYLNRILSTGIRALKYAYENKLIVNDCFSGFVYLKPNPKARKILSLEQAKNLFERKWQNELAKLGNQTAMLTGLRLGEILALTPRDLGENKIYVRHNYALFDGLKCPKNGRERSVPAPAELISMLKRQAATNPYNKGDAGFVFWSTTDSEKPFDRKIWRVELQNELKLMGIKNYREIVFHSWRHFFTTYIEPSLTHSDLQKVTGHLTERMLEHYADHETERALTNVGKAVENILVPIACLDKR